MFNDGLVALTEPQEQKLYLKPFSRTWWYKKLVLNFELPDNEAKELLRKYEDNQTGLIEYLSSLEKE